MTDHNEQRKLQLYSMIDNFLEERRPAGEFGGMAKVEEEDIVNLNKIINKIVAAKFEMGENDALPITHMAIDKNKYFFLIDNVFPHEVGSGKYYDFALRSLSIDISSLARQIERVVYVKTLRDMEKEKE